MNKLFVISLGGSLIFPEEIDVKFLKNLKRLIESEVKKGKKFVIITGGGRVCRKYQAALKNILPISKSDLDWMGIYTTQTNANFVRLMFGRLAHPKIAQDPSEHLKFKEKILLGAGHQPGHSTDYDAVILAKTYGANTVVNLSNIDFLYEQDPRKFRGAKKITNISWDGLLKITGKKWNPGANVPFDPIAGKYAKKNKLKVIIANGKNLNNLKKILTNRPFIGTEIK